MRSEQAFIIQQGKGCCDKEKPSGAILGDSRGNRETNVT
jgi:hypothetical protein